MNPRLARQVATVLGAEVTTADAIGGGDINAAYAVTLADSRRLFVKANASAPKSMFEVEARGLQWLRDAAALRIPEVVAVAEQFLALEFIEAGRPAPEHDDRLGQGLAELHRAGADCFGLDHDNFIGRLPQDNAPAEQWSTFYRDRRLAPQLDEAVRSHRIPGPLRRRFDRLFARLAELVGPPEPPARLHGDLWGGNAHVDSTGKPCLIDPAVYGGHREVDLAMMKLFGGFRPRVYEAYQEAYPLADSWQDRLPLYQLYPLLVHVNLFGGGYVGRLESTLAAVDSTMP